MARSVLGLAGAFILSEPSHGGDLDSIGLWDGNGINPLAISGDGNWVVGTGSNKGGVNTPSRFGGAFLWSQSTGFSDLGITYDAGRGFPIGAYASDAQGVNTDGTAVVGELRYIGTDGDPHRQGYLWTPSTGVVSLPGSTTYGARGVSGDGSVVVGTMGFIGAQAYRWTSATGTTGLGWLPGGGQSEAYGVSADGNVVVGYSYTTGTGAARAFQWTSGGGMTNLGFLLGGTENISYANAANADGSVIVGASTSANRGASQTEAFRWNSATGMVGLGGTTSSATAVSADGSTIVGGGSQGPFRWTPSTGVQTIADILTANGISLSGAGVIGTYNSGGGLRYVNGISADGLTILLGGSGVGGDQAWRANIPLNAFALLDLQGVDHSIGSLVWGGTVTNSGPNNARLTAGSDNTSTTFSGVIQDGTSATALTKTGTGTLTLTGANTYTGGTIVSGGTLQLGDASNLGKIVGIVLNNATLNVFNADTSGIASITNNANVFFRNSSSAGHASITGGGGLQFFDASTAGDASITYTGILQFLNSSTAGNASITNNYNTQFLDNSTAGNASITNNSTIDFRNSSTAGYASITNNNYMEFSGTSTAGNATIINNVPLFSGSDLAFLGNSTGGQARLVNNAGATIDFSGTTGPNSDNKITAGSIEGAGNYYLGANQLTVGGNNLDAMVGGIISDAGSGAVNPFATGGSILKVGNGTLMLANSNTYTGATTVNAGTMSITGDISSSSGVSVNSGGTLSGTGTVPNVSINAGGTLMPGLPSAIGALNVGGNLGFASAAAYQIAVNGTNASSTITTGTATLGGAAVNVTNGSALVTGHRYTILTASGGLSGTFSPITRFGIYTGTLSYDPNNVFLAFNNITQIASLLPTGAPTNLSNITNGIDRAVNGGSTLSTEFQRLYSFSVAAFSNALTQISGEAGGHGGSHAVTNMMGSFLTLALNPFGGSSGGNIGGVGGGRGFGFAAEAELPREAVEAYAAVTPTDRRAASTLDRRWGIWGQAYGGLSKTDGDTSTGTHDTTSRSYGLATGADYHASPDLMVGFALAGGGTNYGLSDGLGGGKSDVFQMGFYGSKQFGPAYVSAALSYAWHGMQTSRTVTISGTDTLTASFNAHSFGGRLESGYKFDVPFVSITPYAAIQMQQFRTPSYSEIAASGSNAFALTYDAKSTTSTRTELGVWLDKMIALDRGNVLAIRTRAAWAHDQSSDESSSAAFQTLPGSNFTVNGAGTVPNSALMSAGAEVRLASGVSFSAKFDGEFAYHSQTYAGTVTVRSAW